jgi:FkbM family methyltransferase
VSILSNVRTFVRALGFDVVRYAPDLARPFDVLPFLVRARLAMNPSFFFVQIGANDGILDDPLRDLIRQHRLRGLLVEPLPDMFKRLVENYAGSEGLIFENIAIDATRGVTAIHRVKIGASGPSWWHGLASFDRAHLVTVGVPESCIETLQVETMTMQTLLSKHGVKDIDLLQVDTEGHDHVILEGVLDAGFLPKIICYEHCNLTRKVKLSCKRLLDSYEYQFAEVSWKDTVAMQPQAFGERDSARLRESLPKGSLSTPMDEGNA